MRTISAATLSKEMSELLKIAQTERVVVTRNGKPSAILLGIENKDQEDRALEGDPAFWHMIHERRKEKKEIPLAQLKKRLRMDTERGPGKQAKKKNELD